MTGLRNHNHAAQNAMYNQQLGVQQTMMSGVAIGAAEKQYTDAFVRGACSVARDKTRTHIANEVEKMAEEIGAPTLLHAVVLAIRTMEIPE